MEPKARVRVNNKAAFLSPERDEIMFSLRDMFPDGSWELKIEKLDDNLRHEVAVRFYETADDQQITVFGIKHGIG